MQDYMILAPYLRDEATMNHQGARIADHVTQMGGPTVTFRWENPAGVTMSAGAPLTNLLLSVIESHYGVTVIPL